jgi:diadenosine tetraphosphatase ApaH/serine/threonine PP2A family protein phosphatase
MKFAAIADVHGNIAALEAVLADIAALGITDVVNLGDHVSGPLEAARTADLLMACGFPSIRGDQDRRLVELSGTRLALDRVDYNQLAPAHLDWMASLPETLVYRGEVLLCHGSPRDDAAYWLDQVTENGAVIARPLAAVEAEAVGVEASLILCAHTHLPRVVRLSDGRLVVNPGSVGLPAYDGQKPVYHVVQTGTPDACYAVLERVERGWSVTLRHVPYDAGAMAALARRNGAELWARAVETGWFAVK